MLNNAQRSMILEMLDMVEEKYWEEFSNKYFKSIGKYASALEFKLIKEEIELDDNYVK